jgi:radial spoke head protein 4A
MLTRGNDYYVIETFIAKTYPDKVQSDTEPRSQIGVNQLTYWVTNDLLSDWVELPLISPKHILQAR